MPIDTEREIRALSGNNVSFSLEPRYTYGLQVKKKERKKKKSNLTPFSLDAIRILLIIFSLPFQLFFFLLVGANI